jgi:predicted RNA binding protein YcfA (HicA-like mRNA interferase family)
MAGAERLLARARNRPAGMSFADFERLLRLSGWNRVRTEGSHQVWRSPNGHMLPIQPRGKDAKEYQVRQFVKEYDKER